MKEDYVISLSFLKIRQLIKCSIFKSRKYSQAVTSLLYHKDINAVPHSKVKRRQLRENKLKIAMIEAT
jgi:hypothetical protein